MIEIIIEAGQTIYDNGLTVGSVIGAVLLLLRNRAIKRRFPSWMRDAETNDILEIQAKLDYLIERSGGRWTGNSQTLLRTAQTNSYKSFTLSQVVKSIYQKGRRKMQNLNVPSLVVGLLGAVKTAAQAWGYDIITVEQINAIANLVAVGFMIYGVLASHNKADRAH